MPSDVGEDLGPLLELAREIKREVARVAADDGADVDELTEAIEQFPREERRRVVVAVFERLPADMQWEVLARVFNDTDLRDYLADVHEQRRIEVARDGARSTALASARAARSIDASALVPGDQITIGLFREVDVATAVPRGSRSDACARSLSMRCFAPGDLRVIEDVFNPRGTYFVTREYDMATWEAERFASHERVAVGALSGATGETRFEPMLHLGGRVDFVRGTEQLTGRLHVGFVILNDIDVFAGPV